MGWGMVEGMDAGGVVRVESRMNNGKGGDRDQRTGGGDTATEER
jgi:hypothetical protein